MYATSVVVQSGLRIEPTPQVVHEREALASGRWPQMCLGQTLSSPEFLGPDLGAPQPDYGGWSHRLCANKFQLCAIVSDHARDMFTDEY